MELHHLAWATCRPVMLPADGGAIPPEPKVVDGFATGPPTRPWPAVMAGRW